MKAGATIGILVLALALMVSAQAAFTPPEAIVAGKAYSRYQAVPDGLIVMDVSLSADGSITGIDALRNVGDKMLDAAKNAVNTWKFQPALEGGKAVPSSITVNFVYRPSGATTQAVSSSFMPVLPKAAGGYAPPGVVSFAYPDYPPDSIEFESVVLQVALDATGAVTGAEYLHRWTPFNQLAMDVLKKWRFQPATLNGKPIASKTVVAFLFE